MLSFSNVVLGSVQWYVGHDTQRWMGWWRCDVSAVGKRWLVHNIQRPEMGFWCRFAVVLTLPLSLGNVLILASISPARNRDPHFPSRPALAVMKHSWFNACSTQDGSRAARKRSTHFTVILHEQGVLFPLFRNSLPRIPKWPVTLAWMRSHY